MWQPSLCPARYPGGCLPPRSIPHLLLLLNPNVSATTGWRLPRSVHMVPGRPCPHLCSQIAAGLGVSLGIRPRAVLGGPGPRAAGVCVQGRAQHWTARRAAEAEQALLVHGECKL